MRGTAADSGTSVESTDDSYCFRWLVLRGKDFDELQLKAQIGSDLPVEQELERWFPLWGAPI